jgi:DNA-binding NtrC family response regulator
VNLREHMPVVLVADDHADVLESLRLLFKTAGIRAEMASSPRDALEIARTRELDAALVDLNYARDTTSGQEGLDLLSALQAVDSSLPIVVMTAWGSVDVAVEAMRRGARDFIEKPWENERLLSVLRSQVALARALRRGQRLEAENRLLRAHERPALVAESPAMRRVVELVTRVAPSDANVLVTGEHGTGKDVVARTLHALSPRADNALIAVDLGGLSEGVFTAELFGHVRGAFTDAKTDRVGRFELADGGTLFLDEIANIPLAQQPALLRALETREIQPVGSPRSRRLDVRVVSATNADLEAAVAEGRFRADLLYRLNTVHVHLPPLRERREDILPLAMHFLGRYAERYDRGGGEALDFEPAALRALETHAWPGNVRELSHVVERAVLLARGPRVRVDDLALARPATNAPPRLEDLPLEEVERILVERVLRRHGGNVSRAAAALGLSRAAFYRRLEKHGL